MFSEDTAKPLPGRTLGNESAQIIIEEYASMSCGHCASFHNNTLFVSQMLCISVCPHNFKFGLHPYSITRKKYIILTSFLYIINWEIKHVKQ